MKNEGNLDRALRVIAGLAILSLTVIGPQSLWGLVGTGAIGDWRHRFLSTIQGARHQYLSG
jgi:ABC-type methionine transport system permease subunit